MLNNSYKKVAISKSTNIGTTSVTIARNNNTIKLNGIAVSGNTVQDINLLDKSKFPATQTINGITFTNNGDGTITVESGTATRESYLRVYECTDLIKATYGHKFAMFGGTSYGETTEAGTKITLCFRLEINSQVNLGGADWTGNGNIFTNNKIATGSINHSYAYIYSVSSGQTITNLVFKPQLYDLTAIYGEGNEPTTVEQFLKDYPEPYQIPSPTSPVSIKNSNDNGIKFTLQGKNLFDKNLAYLKSDYDLANCTLIATTENGWIIKGKDYNQIGNALYYNGWFRPLDYEYLQGRGIYLNKGDIVTVSADYTVLENPYPNSSYPANIYLYGDKSQPSNLPKLPPLNITERRNKTFTISASGRYYPVFTLNSTTIKIENIQVEIGSTRTEYEPYFKKTVEIPSSVTLSNGVSLSINLAKVGDNSDKLSVKGSRAIYSQSTEKITFTGEESGWSEADGVYKYSFDKPLIANVGYCTHFKLSDTGEENTFGVESDGITFKKDAATGLDNFKAWLKAKSDAGGAVQVTVALASPVEYDLSDTELGQSLLSLASGSYAQTVIAKSDSTIPTSEISVDSAHQYESYKTIRYVHETPTSENSSNLQISNNKAIMTINSLELTGGATATTEDIVVTRSGKNLLDGNLRATPKTLNGITIRYLPDEDCYLLNGTCTANSSHYLITHNLFVNGRITASMVVISGTCEGSAQFSISYRDNLSETTFPLWVTKNIINGNLSINQGAHKYIGATWFFIAKGTSFNNYKIKIQIEKGLTVTEYEPYLPPKSLTFSRDYLLSLKGVNNLLDKSKFLATQKINGLTFTNNGDGTITADGTATARTVYYFYKEIIESTSNKFLLLGTPNGGSFTSYWMEAKCYDNEDNLFYLQDIGNGRISIKRLKSVIDCHLVIAKDTTVSNLVFKPELYDLTEIYGEGNEPTTVEQFLKDYPLSSTDKINITKDSVKYNNVDITEQVTGLSDFMATNTETAIIDTNYTMGSISADVKKLFVSYKKSIYQADE